VPRINEPSDATDLVQRARARDRQALSELYRIHADMVYRVAYRMTESSAEAQDVTQDVFLGLPDALRPYEETGRFDRWLRMVTVRRSLQRMRQQRRRREVGLGAIRHAAVRRDPGLVIESVALERALAQLPLDLRTVYVLFEIEGFSHREIAATLGIRQNLSEVRLHRARTRLVELLGGRR
jgi:RNA polymerase sigma-70 factor (ECF subfamily)